MAEYPKSVIDSLNEYSEKYRLNTQEYKDLMNRLEKIPISSLEKVNVYNKGKANIERGSIIVIRVPTTKGFSTRAYISLTGMPSIKGEGGEIPILDLHSLNILEDSAIDSIKKIPTSDNTKKNETNTEGMFIVNTVDLRAIEHKEKEENAPIEIFDVPKKAKKKQTKKKETEKKEEIKKEATKKTVSKKVKKEDIIDLPETSKREEKSREKILETAKKIKEDREKEKEREANRKLDDAYKKMRFACVTTIHNMGYTKREAESACDDIDIILQEHAQSAIDKRTPNAVEEYIRLLTEKVIPTRISKPKKGKPFIPHREITPEEFAAGMVYANPEGLLEMACLWLMSRYNQPTDRSFNLCEERRGDIIRLARAMAEGRMDLIKATKELENIIIEKSQLTTVISGYKEQHGEDAKQQIKLAEEKRRKISSKAKEEAVLNSFKESTTTVGYKARGELQRRASEKLEKMIGTSTREISVQLKGKAAIILEFQCYKATGLDKTGCFREYINKIQEEYGFNLVEIPNGWAAHFQANVLPGGDIVMTHYGKEYTKFLEMIEKIKDEYEKPQHVLVWVNSFVDKSEYSRIL